MERFVGQAGACCVYVVGTFPRKTAQNFGTLDAREYSTR